MVSSIKQTVHSMMSPPLHITPTALSKATIRISGFKHLLAPCMLTSLAMPHKIELSNVPLILERTVLTDLLTLLNVNITHSEDYLCIDAQQAIYSELPETLTNKIHGSIYLLPVVSVDLEKSA